jgi:NADPH:quinone reductase-like Zn-dependent oxidoreductase
MRAPNASKPDHPVTDTKISNSRPVAHPIPQDGNAPQTVTVNIASAALNPVDYKLLEGTASAMIRTWPHVPGCDTAGTVAGPVAGPEEGCTRKVPLYLSPFAVKNTFW